MTRKTAKSKCVILDAMIIITAHELGIWLSLVDRLDIIIPSTIARDEALFFSRKEGGIPQDIDLSRLIQEKQIIEIGATIEVLADLQMVFDSVFIIGLHEGETEALALLKSGKAGDAFFCTSDVKAIQALAMIDKSDRGISFEKLLQSIGLAKSLPVHYSQDFFRRAIKEGQNNRITGQGMRRKGIQNI